MSDANCNEPCQTCGKLIRLVGTRHKPRWLHLDVVRDGHTGCPADSAGPMASAPGFL